MIIYNHLLISDPEFCLRSVAELRSHNSPNDVAYLPKYLWVNLIGLPRHIYRCLFSKNGSGSLPRTDSSYFAPTSNLAILFVSRKINQEATHIFCARNKFHYSCIRSFPGASLDLLSDVPWPVPFTGAQLHFMRILSLDYSNSHYHQWTDAAETAIDNCMARNITHISDSCPSLKLFLLYVFSRPLLAPHFHGRLGTGQTARALGGLRKRLDWLNVGFFLPDTEVMTFVITMVHEVWRVGQDWQLEPSALPMISISGWQFEGIQKAMNLIRVWRLDCKKTVKEEEVRNQARKAEVGQCGDDKPDRQSDGTLGDSLFGSG